MSDSEPIRILIIDDQPVVRAGIRLIIKSNTAMTVVGEAGNSAEGLALASGEQPDVILLDLDLGEENGLDLLPRLRSAAPKAKVLILTGMHAVELHRRAVRTGAMGVVLKEKDPEVLIAAITSAQAGEIWIDRSLMASLLEDEPAG
jgi:two-component system nitrate/nitrite response regulator NarL